MAGHPYANAAFLWEDLAEYDTLASWWRWQVREMIPNFYPTQSENVFLRDT